MSIGLVGCFDDLMHMLSSDKTVDIIYLAIDKIDHGVFLHKLKDLSITGKLGIWFRQFLTNRTHNVRIPVGISKYSFEWRSPRHSPGTTIILNYDIRHQ